MSTPLFMDAPIITLGRTEADGRTVDLWVGSWPNLAASLHRGGRTAGALTIYEGCPDEWLTGITGIWMLLGANPDADLSVFATHRLVVDGFRPAVLEPITAGVTL